MDKDQIKTAIREELGRKVGMSGGPEVFRRLVRGSSAVVETALRELVAEGLLSETRLRVGKIYHYPANTAVRLDILAGFMKKAAEAPARPTRDPNAPRPARAAAEPRAAPVPPSETSGADHVGVRTSVRLPGSEDKRTEVRTPANRETPPQAAEPPTTTEKPAWVPKKATPRDPNKPRPVPRAPAAAPTATPEFAAAATDADATGLSPKREPEGAVHAAETDALTAGPPWAPEKAGLPPAQGLSGAFGDAGAAHDTPARAGPPPGPPTTAELTEPAPPAPGQAETAPRPQETPHG